MTDERFAAATKMFETSINPQKRSWPWWNAKSEDPILFSSNNDGSTHSIYSSYAQIHIQFSWLFDYRIQVSKKSFFAVEQKADAHDNVRVLIETPIAASSTSFFVGDW